MNQNILWQNVTSDTVNFIKIFPFAIGVVLAFLFFILLLKKRGEVPSSFVKLSLIAGLFSLIASSVSLSYLQYQAFMDGPFKYALPPYKPLADYFLGYVFFNFWAFWIIGLIITAIVSIYWLLVKIQSGGLRISTQEILVFILFGGLTAWPAVIIYVFTVFVMYIAALVALNLARLDKQKRIPGLKLLHRFIREDEIRIPIMPYFVLAAPIALIFSPFLFSLLGLTGLYVAPRMFY